MYFLGVSVNPATNLNNIGFPNNASGSTVSKLTPMASYGTLLRVEDSPFHITPSSRNRYAHNALL